MVDSHRDCFIRKRFCTPGLPCRHGIPSLVQHAGVQQDPPLNPPVRNARASTFRAAFTSRHRSKPPSRSNVSAPTATSGPSSRSPSIAATCQPAEPRPPARRPFQPCPRGSPETPLVPAPQSNGSSRACPRPLRLMFLICNAFSAMESWTFTSMSAKRELSCRSAAATRSRASACFFFPRLCEP